MRFLLLSLIVVASVSFQLCATGASASVEIEPNPGVTSQPQTNGEHVTSDAPLSDLQPLQEASNSQIVSTVPVAYELGVAPDISISVSFANDMNPLSFDNTTIRIHASSTGLHEASFSYESSTKTVMIDPNSPFEPGEQVTAVLTTDLELQGGTPLDSSYTWSWTTDVDPSTGSFSVGQQYSTSDVYSAITSGDFDGDGDLDLAASGFGQSVVAIWLNDGAGGFEQSASSPSVGEEPLAICSGDVDNDGDIDLIVASSIDTTVSVVPNTGAGVFGFASTYKVSHSPYSLAVADLNGDGYVDIVTANRFDSSASVLLNDGSGSFGTKTDFRTGMSPRTVLAFDIDGDADVDLVVACRNDSSLTLLMNDGAGDFSQGGSVPKLARPALVTGGDIDGDGDVDLVTVAAYWDSLSVIFNDGAGNFGSTASYFVGGRGYAAHLSDLDGDDLPDLVVTFPDQNHPEASGLLVLRNMSGGVFAHDFWYDLGNLPFAICEADLDGDSKLDLAVSGEADDYLSILYNRAPARLTSFSPGMNELAVSVSTDVTFEFQFELDSATTVASTILVRGSTSGPHSADITYSSFTKTITVDPDEDFAAGEIVTAVLTDGVQSSEGAAFPGFLYSFTTEAGVGPGTFAEDTVSYSVDADPYSLALSDFNGDNWIDFVTANHQANNVSVVMNAGDGSFASGTSYASGIGACCVSAADVDRDGDDDILVANGVAANVRILVNNAGSFSAGALFPTGNAPSGLSAIDLNADGSVDLVVANEDDNSLWVREGNGAGGFSSQKVFPTGSGPAAACYLDINRDGSLDVVTVDADADSISVFENTGGSSLLRFDSSYYAGDNPRCVVAADFDGDGWVDLAVGDLNSRVISVLFNDIGQFQSLEPCSLLFFPYKLWAADVDGDADIDLICGGTGTGTGQVCVIENDGNGVFTPGDVYSVGGDIRAVASADIDDDGDLDILAADITNDQLYVLRNRIIPKVISTSPFSGDGSAPVNAQIDIEFNDDMDPVTISSVTITATGSISGRLDVGLSYSAGSMTATLSPAVPFEAGEQVWVTVTDGVKTSSGYPLSAPYTFSFIAEGNAGGSSFQPAGTYAVADTVTSVAVGDVDDDGDLDLITADRSADRLTILENDGNGAYGIGDTYTVGDCPSAVIGIDINGDGYQDPVTANTFGSSVTALINNTDGTFSAQPAVTTTSEPQALGAGDLDGDGDMDIAVVCEVSSGSVDILVNDGSGGFVVDANYPIGTQVGNIVAADFDADGDVDLAVGRKSGTTITILSNSGNGEFPYRPSVVTGTGPAVLYAADFDGDNYVDLITANGTIDSIAILPNAATGSIAFGSPQALPVSGGPGFVTAADVNGDKFLDLLVGRTGDNNVSVLTGDGSGGFSGREEVATGDFPVFILAADVNQDALIDMAVVEQNSGSLSVKLNLFELTIWETSPVRNHVDAGRSADIYMTFNADVDPSTVHDSSLIVHGQLSGRHDGAVSYDAFSRTAVFDPDADFEFGELVEVVLTDGVQSVFGPYLPFGFVWSFRVGATPDSGGTLESMDAYVTGGDPVGVCAGDFDADGDIDAITVNRADDNVSLFTNDGNGQLSTSTTVGVGDNPYSVSTADFDGVNGLDFATANRNAGTVSVALNNGDGTIASAVDYSVGDDPYGIAAVDANGDGWIDLVSANNLSDDVTVLYNDGHGVFSTQATFAAGNGPYAVSGGDLNGDGSVDLAVVDFETDAVAILLNSGEGLFDSPITYSVGDGPRAVELGDFDGDGDLDLATADATGGTVTILENNQLGVLSLDTSIQVGIEPYGLAALDYDGDGDLDIVSSNLVSNHICVLRNSGSGEFAMRPTVPVNGGPRDVAAADMNGDGILDILVVSVDVDSLVVFANHTVGCCGQYTAGYTGNTNCDEAGAMNLQDVTRLIDHIYISKTPLCCDENGDTNGDGSKNLQDVTRLIDHIYLSKNPTAPCP